jgi:hypothetical protein
MPNQILYGFVNLQNVFAERVTGARIEEVDTAIVQSVEEHNRQLNALLSLFADPVTVSQRRFKSAVAARLQPLDENGRAKPILPAGYYDTGFPLFDAGTAWGANFIARAKMTVADANRVTRTMIGADKRWVRDQLLSALFAAANYNYSDPDDGTIVVKPIANGDTDTYLLMSGSDQNTTADHIVAQAATVADATNPFPAMYTALTSHPENGGDVVAFIPTNLKAAVEGLGSFYPTSDANLRMGTGQTELVGRLGVALPGPLLGYEESGVWIVEWPSLPDNYIIGTTTEGDRPLGMRQHPEAELQGFSKRAERNDHPFYESQFSRHLGFGANNRVNAYVVRVGNGTYAVPTGYTPPVA